MQKCAYSEFLQSAFGLNTEKYGSEKLQIQTLFKQCLAFIMILLLPTYHAYKPTKLLVTSARMSVVLESQIKFN